MTESRIEDWKRLCRESGMDPSSMPEFNERYAPEQLSSHLRRYAELMDICRSFTDEFLSSLPDNPMLVAISDAEGYILGFFGNKSIEGILEQLGIVPGVRFSEAVGPNAIALCLSTGKPVKLMGEDHYHIALQGSACYTSPLFLHREDTRPWAAVSFMMMAENSHPQLMALLRSMTGSMERELELRQRNNRQLILTQALLQTPHYGVVLADPEGRIVLMNKPILELLQLEHDAQGEPCDKLPLVGPPLKVMLEGGGGPVLGLEMTAERAEGQRHYLLDLLPITDEDGGMLFAVAMLRDMTAARQSDEMLQGAEKLVFAGQLAVSIAHEIRNPLTVIRGMLQFTSTRIKKEHYELIMDELDRINLIVGDFMGLGKKQPPALQLEETSRLVEETLQVVEFQCRLDGIALHREYETHGHVLCDRNQIKQVLLNVLRNATEATPEGGQITVRLAEEEGWQRIEIIDTGVGMTSVQIARIGEPFRTSKKGGSGLGLAIVKRIMESHGGRLRFQSEPGQGTTAVLEFVMQGQGTLGGELPLAPH
ncbi:ATP-binding protein [Paenibacillus herberti]|uniref:histidine kinase n=1 Tax=Paenibacillus herberti TaxID=1619309 RepID=A0A229NY51_9BACL|nr:ATP-binding protein [Paenibacillus herberti]OXM14681.1 PAS domain-containing sensor histidine kinase [Paenibacillus herberti]